MMPFPGPATQKSQVCTINPEEFAMNCLHGPAIAAALLLCGCAQAERAPEPWGDAAPADTPASPQHAFWSNLRELCEAAAKGSLLQAPDAQIDPSARLVVHFWECGDEELRFPLHVDENRSRTWVFIRHADHLELRHDHRHEDGSEESNTWYGATTLAEGTANRQEFVMDRNGVQSGWRVEIEPGQRFTYGTIRDGEWRHHLQFDLTEAADIPPLPWGHATRPSQRR
jgi:hypothetical protein